MKISYKYSSSWTFLVEQAECKKESWAMEDSPSFIQSQCHNVTMPQFYPDLIIVTMVKCHGKKVLYDFYWGVVSSAMYFNKRLRASDKKDKL